VARITEEFTRNFRPLLFHPAPIGDMHHEQLFKLRERLPSHGRIVPITHHLLDELPLSCDVLLARCHMLASLRKVLP
jgi:hypothetical protein